MKSYKELFVGLNCLILSLLVISLVPTGCGTGGDDIVLDGSISGTVINNLTGEPVGVATVTLTGFEQKTQVTGSDGVFRFDNITIGTYGLSAQNPNYYSNNVSVTLQTLEAVTADIPLDPIPPLTLSPTMLDFGTSRSELNLVIKNTSSTAFNYEVQSPNTWITLSKSSGALSAQNSDAIMVTASREALGNGNTEGSITFNVPGRGSVAIQVLITK